MLAWHFTNDTLKDGRPLPAIGETLIHTGPLIPCRMGYHASELLVDALDYAPGPHLWRVRLGGEIIPHVDKLVASERTGLFRFEATSVLRVFARKCALDVAHLWAMPPVVREYLETGREDIRAAARDAARDAAGDAAWDAAGDTAGDAARAAARDAARDAAWAAARASTLDSPWNPAGAAAMAAQNARLTEMVMAEANRLGYTEE